jgi:hypothetical protein
MNQTRTLLAFAITSVLTACGGGNDNQAPVFEKEIYAFTTIEEQEISGSVVAVDNETINYTVVNAASNGVFALNANGTFTYTPNADFYGLDSVSVQASDGNEGTNVIVNFNVSAVNDAPVLSTTAINVTSSGETMTTLSVVDVDNDAITFSLVKAPENGVLTLSNTGEITYKADELGTVSGSFIVSYTDGVIEAPIEASIALQPSLITNADKLGYYYSSTRSHLEKAELIKATLVDDVAADDVNIGLVGGYYAAGFDNKAQSILDSMSDVVTKAKAYQEAALIFDATNRLADAARLRRLSEQNYNLYLVDKGLDNINSNDATFYLGLNNNYIDAGQIEESSQLMTRVKIYADAVREEEYNRAYGYFLTSFNKNAKAAVTIYLEDRTDSNFDKAEGAIQYLADLAEKSGYRLSTRRGDYNGERTDSTKALYSTWAAEFFYNIGAIEQAKKYTALALSVYGDVGYDSNYVYEISPHSEATLDGYFYSLVELTGLFSNLYPELSVNLALTRVTLVGKSRDIAAAQASLFKSEIVTAMINGDTVNDATKPAFDYFIAKEDYQGLYETLVEKDRQTPGAAIELYSIGEVDKAKQLLNAASNILTSDEYIDDVGYSFYITGSRGCNRLTDLQQKLGGDVQAQVDICEALANSYINNESNPVTVSTEHSALRDLMETFALVDNKEKIASTADTILSLASSQLITDIEDSEYIETIIEIVDKQVEVANYLNRFGLFEKSQPILITALATLDTMILSDDVEQFENVLEVLNNILAHDDSETGRSHKFSYIYGVKQNISNINNYATYYATSVDAIKALVTKLTTKVLTLPNNDIQNMMEDLVLINFNAGHYSKVTELISHSINAYADVLQLNQNVANGYVAIDDFPGTDIALIDTDHDGMPNFFAADATEADISASGLVLDQDSDNDGIADVDDNSPLGE